jgi:type IV pilus assembly protein PilC
MTGIGVFMIVVIVPQLTAMLKDFNSELPLATRILIGVSDSVVNHGIVWGGGLILLIIIIIKTLSTHAGKYYFQSITLRLPVFGSIIKKIDLAKFARNISSLLKTDIMIIKSFQITGNVLGNLHYRAAILDMAEKIKKGGTIYDVICTYPKLFPPIVTQMVAIGEQTGELDSILQQLAEFYEDEVDQIMQNLPSIIEPLLILVMGVGVGGMAIAIIMPMYSISSSI